MKGQPGRRKQTPDKPSVLSSAAGESSNIRRRPEEELFHIFRISSPIGLFLIQNGKFVFVNDIFRGITGRSPDELIGTDPLDLVLLEDRAMVRQNAVRMLKGERAVTYKYRILNKSNEIRWMQEGLVSVQYQGRRAALGHSLDITEREESEAKLHDLYEQERKLRQDLEAEVRTRIEFTRALVHELKTPLTPILASSELLVSLLHDEPALSIAQNVYRGADNLNKRVDELLDLARVEVGMLKVETKAVDALLLLRAIAGEVSPLISSNHQSLTVELPSSLPRVWADEERMRQIVLNLLINASKFTPEGGSITLRARTRDGTLVVEVQDTGPGIPEAAQQNLFQPYHRALNDREHLGGLGLGLALSRHLVRLQDGTIWVESEVGKGSTFGFSLPLATTKQREEILTQESR